MGGSSRAEHLPSILQDLGSIPTTAETTPGMPSVPPTHTCAFSAYIISSMSTYQYGVPTKELAGELMEADPKSASFTCPGSVRRIFPALTSLQEKKRSIRELTSPFLLCRRLEHAISTIRSFLNKHTSILFSAVTACCKGARIPGWSLEGLPESAVFRGRGRARGKGSHARQGELPDGDPYKACSSAF